MSRTAQPRERQTEWVEINGRLVRPGGTSEVATELGVTTTRVTTWVSRRKIGANGQTPPGHVLPRFAMGPVYDLDEWRAWFGLDERAPMPTT